MSKKRLAGRRLYTSFVNHYWFIFYSRKVRNACSKSVDFDGILTGFVLGLISNQLGDEKAHTFIWQNRKELKIVFQELESNSKLKDVFDLFNNMPNISIDEINDYKKIFKSNIDAIIDFLDKHKIYLQIENNELRKILSTAFIYLLYSMVDCAVEKNLDEILKDPKYEDKVKMITNNTRLFSNLRQLLLKSSVTISDFIGLINGMTRPLGKD